MSHKQRVVCLVSGAIIAGVIWCWYNKSVKEKVMIPKKKKLIDRYTHFLSIRITNGSLISLGQQIQDEIVDEYKKKDISINSSLIKPAKFHISLNILSLSNQEKLNKFCNGLNLFQQWLKIFIFDDKSIDKQLFALQEDGIFLNILEKNDYFNKFGDIYHKLLSSNTMNKNGFPFHCEGVSHFNQSVIFLDFQNKSKIDSNHLNDEYLRNILILQLIGMIYEFIGKLCKEYKIKCDKKKLNPHCTVMKLSKMKRNEMKKLLKYNKTNKIHKKGRGGNKIYDINVLSLVLNEETIENKIKLLEKNEYENVTHIDLCAMQGISNDGYYKIVRSSSIIP